MVLLRLLFCAHLPLMIKIWGVNDLASDDSRLRILTIGARKRHLTIGLKVTFVFLFGALNLTRIKLRPVLIVGVAD